MTLNLWNGFTFLAGFLEWRPPEGGRKWIRTMQRLERSGAAMYRKITGVRRTHVR